VRTSESSPSSNGRRSDHGMRPWTRLGIDRRSTGYCRVTFDHSPMNIITATTVAELGELVALIEEDADLNVVVFDSAIRDHYLAHHEVDDDRDRTAVGPTWNGLLARLAHAPVVSIASIRGRASYAGSEFVLACDLRFASREHSSIGQFGFGRLCAVVGRARALEVVLTGDDLDGPRAERYGCVNRVIADDRLDAEVEAIASRLAHCDHDVIARAKASVDRATSWAERGRPPAAA
jgi:enoyl-CoA hydratase/carnithine racemase